MKTWFKEYRDTMYRTRAIGVVGAGSVVAAVVLEVLRIFKALSIAEGPFEKDLMWNVLGSLTLYTIVGVFFISRIWILLSSTHNQYYRQVASWICACTSIGACAWFIAPPSSPTYQCVEESGRVCFGIYEMSRSADLVVLSGLLFMLLGILRAVVTGVYAATKYSYK
jgi:hypothetical protein